MPYSTRPGVLITRYAPRQVILSVERKAKPILFYGTGGWNIVDFRGVNNAQNVFLKPSVGNFKEAALRRLKGHYRHDQQGMELEC